MDLEELIVFTIIKCYKSTHSPFLVYLRAVLNYSPQIVKQNCRCVDPHHP